MSKILAVNDFHELAAYSNQLLYLEQELYQKKDKKSFELDDGCIVSYTGLIKDQEEKINPDNISQKNINVEEIKKALIFIDNILEKIEHKNYKATSNTLKEYAVNYLKYNKVFEDQDCYISNGSFIIALSLAGFDIHSIKNESSIGLNILTNFKTLENFESNLYLGKYKR